MKELKIKRFIEEALLEDMPYGDITTDHLIHHDRVIEGTFIAKEDGVIAGLEIGQQVFHTIDSTIQFELKKTDGEVVKKGEVIMTIKGKAKSILKGERLALNIMQRMSGISTLTRAFVERVKPYNTKIVDTRKTTPLFRLFEKEAVVIGGGSNHRFNLSDAVMIKDNHIQAAGGITNAVMSIRDKIPHTTKIEVEVEDLEMLEEALNVKADIIMLDNMSVDMMKQAVEITNKQAILEASGNMTLERVNEVAACGVDIISVGALTHSYHSLDISLRFLMK